MPNGPRFFLPWTITSGHVRRKLAYPQSSWTSGSVLRSASSMRLPASISRVSPSRAVPASPLQRLPLKKIPKQPRMPVIPEEKLYSWRRRELGSPRTHFLYTQRMSRAEAMIQSVQWESTLGFAMESRPRRKAAVIQLASAHKVLLFHVHRMGVGHRRVPSIPPGLRSLLESDKVMKIGVGIQMNMSKLYRDFRLSMRSCVDLGGFAQVVDANSWKVGGSLVPSGEKQLAKERKLERQKRKYEAKKRRRFGLPPLGQNTADVASPVVPRQVDHAALLLQVAENVAAKQPSTSATILATLDYQLPPETTPQPVSAAPYRSPSSIVTQQTIATSNAPLESQSHAPVAVAFPATPFAVVPHPPVNGSHLKLRVVALQTLVEYYLGLTLRKDKKTQQSDWENPLTTRQAMYAADEVYATYATYDRLVRRFGPPPLGIAFDCVDGQIIHENAKTTVRSSSPPKVRTTTKTSLVEPLRDADLERWWQSVAKDVDRDDDAVFEGDDEDELNQTIRKFEPRGDAKVFRAMKHYQTPGTGGINR